MGQPEQLSSGRTTIARSHSRTGDTLGVYVLPLACFVADYKIKGLVFLLCPFSVWIFAASGMLTFALSFRMRSSASQATVRAALYTSSIGAFSIGLILAPFSVFAVPLFGIGLLGIVPFLTSSRLRIRARQMPKANLQQIVLGALAVLAPSLGMLMVEVSGELRRRQDVVSGEPDRVLRALSQTAVYTPRDLITAPGSRMTTTICTHLDAIPLQISKVEAAARDVIGVQDEPLSEVCTAILDD